MINPISGVGKKDDLPQAIQQIIGSKHEVTVKKTEYAGHAKDIAKAEHVSYDAIIAIGGDGTVNEIASALNGTKCAMGVVPAGSGNGLARHLTIPLNIKSAIERIAAFDPKYYDTGTVNGDFFVGTAGYGFDGLIAHEFDIYPKRGFLSYAKLVAANYAKYQPAQFTIKIDGKEIRKTALVCAVANSSQFGNGFTISPDSNMQDGRMELIFIDKFPLLSTPVIGTQIFTQKIDQSKHFKSISFENKIEIQVDSNQVNYYHLDGEPKKDGNSFIVEVHPHQLLIL